MADAFSDRKTTPGRGNAAARLKEKSDILKRLETYKQANRTDVSYYRRVIREAPERALDMLLYKDMQQHEADMRVISRQLPQAKAFYEKQPADVKRLIDQRLSAVDPFYKDKTFVDEVTREMRRQGVAVEPGPVTGVRPSL